MRTLNFRSHTISTGTVTAAALALLFAAACGGTTPTPNPSSQQDSGTENEAKYPEEKVEAARASNNGKADWGVDICQRNGWYGDKACDWFCPDEDPDCSVDPIGEDPSGVATKYPIILHHGFMGSKENFWAFHEVDAALFTDNHEVGESEVPPFHSVEVRAGSLAEDVDALLNRTGAEKVNIIAHSMGGLDARYLVSSMGYDDRVASVTTISSPHHGTRIADAYVNLVPGLADDAVDAVAELAGELFSDEGERADVRAALEDLSSKGTERFNENNANVDGVYYQSWAGVSSVLGVRVDGMDEACDGKLHIQEGTMDHMDSLLWGAAAIVAGGTDLELNDGLSTVESAKWGNFRGCLPADHLDEVGQISDNGPNDATGFDHIRFYRNVAFDLAERGY